MEYNYQREGHSAGFYLCDRIGGYLCTVCHEPHQSTYFGYLICDYCGTFVHVRCGLGLTRCMDCAEGDD